MKWLIFGLVFILVLVGCNTDTEPFLVENITNMSYNGHEFVLEEGLWTTKFIVERTEYTVHTHHNPTEVEHIDILGDYNEDVFNDYDLYYITFDPTDEDKQYIALSVGETNSIFTKMIGKGVIAACTNDKDIACKNRPIIECNSTERPVFFFDADNETKVIYEKNCIIISGREMQLVKATERMIFHLLGIMPK